MTRKIIGIVLVALALIGVLLMSQLQPEDNHVSGYIEADEVRLGSRVGGRVQSVHVEEGDTVQQGDLLVELAPYDLLERRAEAESHLAERTAIYQKLKAGFRKEEIQEAASLYEQFKAEFAKAKNGPRPQEIEVAKAELRSAVANYELSQKQRDRTAALFRKEGATQNELDEAEKTLEAANALVEARQEQLELLQLGTREEEVEAAKARMEQAKATLDLREAGNRPEDIAQAEAAMQAAQHALHVIEKQIEELQVKATIPGVVQAIDLQPGDLVSANSPILSVLETGELWVRAYVPEDELDLRLGQRVPVTVDSYPDERFTAKITYIARQAEFTPRNVQTPEERSKQVYRIKVQLLEGLDRLRPGMGADVWLDL